MSTTAFQRRTNLADQTAPVPSQPKKRWRRRWVLVFAGLALVWFLPTIVARTPVVQWAIDMASADLNGRVAVD